MSWVRDSQRFRQTSNSKNAYRCTCISPTNNVSTNLNKEIYSMTYESTPLQLLQFLLHFFDKFLLLYFCNDTYRDIQWEWHPSIPKREYLFEFCQYYHKFLLIFYELYNNASVSCPSPDFGLFDLTALLGKSRDSNQQTISFRGRVPRVFINLSFSCSQLGKNEIGKVIKRYIYTSDTGFKLQLFF